MLSTLRVLFLGELGRSSRLLSHTFDPGPSAAVRLFSKRINQFTTRSHTCGQLTAENVGQTVNLCGWVQFQRMGRFITLRDAYGVTQLIVPQDKDGISKVVKDVPLESVVAIKGSVQKRPPGQENEDMATGHIEVHVEDLKIVNPAVPKLPFQIREFSKAKESLRMQYRYLDFRFPEMQHNLRTRSKLLSRMREFLTSQGFVDVETPTLFRRTPGGAQEFVVPTRHPNQFYSLVQSPQQFKQLLMAGGLDRYFQVARCYRDEGARPDRQPEFTQVDIELSFTTRDEVQKLVESLLTHSLKELVGGPLATPFPQLTYAQAMTEYGTDKPDTRFGLRLQDVTQEVRRCGGKEAGAAQGPEGCAKAVVLGRKAAYFGPTFFEGRQDSTMHLIYVEVSETGKWSCGQSMADELAPRLLLKPGDCALIGCGRQADVLPIMGRLRVACADHLENRGERLRNPKDLCFTWVEDFPLFFPGAEPGEYISAHHPFTQPHPEDAHLLQTTPLKVRGLHYDLVLNGSEVAGGSIRIHDPKLQEWVLESVLREDASQMRHLLDALASGCPPHGGIALGVDRLMAILCGATSIRDVMAFPKGVEGRDLMSGAPSPISNAERAMYHLPPAPEERLPHRTAKEA